MTTAYTSLLGLALPVTGELSGTWGDTVNDYITKYVDSSVAGTQTISGSQTAVTLTRANGGALSQAGSGATGSSQYQVINCTGNPAGTLTVTIDVSTGSPTLSNSTYSQTFAVINGTSTSQSVVVRATTTSGTSTGVTLVSGEKSLIAWNGSDFIKIATSTVDGVSTIAFGTTGLTPSAATSGAVTVAGTLVAANGGTGQSTYTTGDLLYATGSTALSKLGIGTNGQILTSTGTAPQWSTLSGVAVTTFSAGTTGFTPSSATSGAVTLAGTLATTNGGTGLTSFTANGVVYASSSSALTTGSALTFDGTSLSVAIVKRDVDNSFVTLLGGTSSATSAAVYATGPSYSAVSTIYIDSAETVFRSLNGVSSRMTLTSTGLGIGTSSPSAKLDVNGQVRAYYTGGFQVDNAGTMLGKLYYSGGLVLDRASATNFILAQNGSTQATLDTSGNLGLGVTPSAWVEGTGLNVGSGRGGSIFTETVNYGFTTFNANAYYSATNTWKYVTSNAASRYQQLNGVHSWYTAASGTAGNAISFTQVMTLDASGNLLVGTTAASGKLSIAGSSSDAWSSTTTGGLTLNGVTSGISTISTYADDTSIRIGAGVSQKTGLLINGQSSSGGSFVSFSTGGSERARITAAGFTQPVAYADTVSALGNTGTATTINLQTANVFTATLTGNCTFTLSNPIATGSSSFTLILTNDGTAGRTVAWAGGSFVFPGGAASLSRTTTANAVDVWVFFTPNGGTTWYGNIAMKNMTA